MRQSRTTTKSERVALKKRLDILGKVIVRAGEIPRAFWIATASSLVLEGLAFNTCPPCKKLITNKPQFYKVNCLLGRESTAESTSINNEKFLLLARSFQK
jgi:hypothetical protein